MQKWSVLFATYFTGEERKIHEGGGGWGGGEQDDRHNLRLSQSVSKQKKKEKKSWHNYWLNVEKRS